MAAAERSVARRALEGAAKRLLDVTVAGTGLVVLSPAIAAITIADVALLGWPPVFTQRRAGLRGRPFTIFKFRTMSDERGSDGELLPDADRLTTFGSFLRATSLDELPELWNVLKGDMSLVGPRPLLLKYLEYYTPEQMRRHDVRPGITGWVAVNGRNTRPWEERFRQDVWYVDHQSFWLDLKILAKTIEIVLRREGITPEGEVAMREFMGTPRVPGGHAG